MKECCPGTFCDPAARTRAYMRTSLRTLCSSSIEPQGGFTILEVTLALAVLAVALTALSTLQVHNLTLTAEDNTLTEATLAARDLLARLQAGQIPLENGEGEMGEEHPGWRWTLRVEELGVSGLLKAEFFLIKFGMSPHRAIRFWLVAQREPPG